MKIGNNKKRVVRVREGFSDRNSLSPIPKEMQYDNLDSGSRVALFNALKNIVCYQVKHQILSEKAIAKIIVEGLFNDVYNEYEDTFDQVFDDIYKLLVEEPYHTVLTIIEYLCNLVYEDRDSYLASRGYDPSYIKYYQDTRDAMNEVFEEEFIGYRFIGDKITSITNDSEIKEINESAQTSYEKVNESINKAISFLSETGTKDYKNSIKESVMAVEQLLNIILGTNGLTLKNAIEQFSRKTDIDENLKLSIKHLYDYASDTNGIRHGNNKNNDSITFSEAKYVLVICSATVNYLCSIKKGIK